MDKTIATVGDLEEYEKKVIIRTMFGYNIYDIRNMVNECCLTWSKPSIDGLSEYIKNRLLDIPTEKPNTCTITVAAIDGYLDCDIYVLVIFSIEHSPHVKIKENLTVKYKKRETIQSKESTVNEKYSPRKDYLRSEEYCKPANEWLAAPDTTEIQNLTNRSLEDELQHLTPIYVKPKTSTYDYDEIKDLAFNVCTNNLLKEGVTITLAELSNKIAATIKPIMKVPTDTLHVWLEYVDMMNKNGFHSKMGDIVIHVDIFEAPFGKLYNFVFVYETNTKQAVKQEEKVVKQQPKVSEFELNWEPKVDIENTTTNKNYKEDIEKIIHKGMHTYFDWRKYENRFDYITNLVKHYCSNRNDITYVEICDDGKSLFNDYQYTVTVINNGNDTEESFLIVGAFSRDGYIPNLEQNWFAQEEIPLKEPIKTPAYCAVKQLYSGYGCGQPNEKIEIEPKENTNYPSFLTKTDMSVLRVLTQVHLLSGNTGYDNSVCQQASQMLEKKCKIIRKDKLEESYFYISNQAESVWAKIYLLDLIKPTLEKQRNLSVSIDYKQLQILIKSYNDNGGNISFDFDEDRIVEIPDTIG